MKTYKITWQHISGVEGKFATESLYEFSNKLEYLMMDRMVPDDSITVNTIES